MLVATVVWPWVIDKITSPSLKVVPVIVGRLVEMVEPLAGDVILVTWVDELGDGVGLALPAPGVLDG